MKALILVIFVGLILVIGYLKIVDILGENRNKVSTIGEGKDYPDIKSWEKSLPKLED